MKKQLLNLTFVFSPLIPLVSQMSLNFEEEVTKEYEKEQKAQKQKPYGFLYDNKFFKTKKDVLKHYLANNQNVLESVGVIGDLDKAIIDFDFNMLNPSKLPEHDFDKISPVFKTSSGKLISSFDKARKTLVNPAFTSRKYADGFGNFFSSKNNAKNSFASKLASGNLSFNQIYDFNGHTKKHNPLSEQDLSIFQSETFNQLKNFEQKAFALPRPNWKRSYYQKQNKQKINQTSDLIGQELTDDLTTFHKTFYDHYGQVKLVSDQRNNLDLVFGQPSYKTPNKNQDKWFLHNFLNKNPNNNNLEFNLTGYQNNPFKFNEKTKEEMINELNDLKEDFNTKEEVINDKEEEVKDLEKKFFYLNDENMNIDKILKDTKYFHGQVKNKNNELKGVAKFKTYQDEEISGDPLVTANSVRDFYMFLNREHYNNYNYSYNTYDYSTPVSLKISPWWKGLRFSNKTHNYSNTEFLLDTWNIKNDDSIDIKLYWDSQKKDLITKKTISLSDQFKDLKNQIQNVWNKFLKFQKNSGKVILNDNFSTVLEKINIGQIRYKANSDAAWWNFATRKDDSTINKIYLENFEFFWRFNNFEIKYQKKEDVDKINRLNSEIQNLKRQKTHLEMQINNLEDEINANKIYLPKKINFDSWENNDDLLNGEINNSKNVFRISYNHLKHLMDKSKNSTLNIEKDFFIHVQDKNTSKQGIYKLDWNLLNNLMGLQNNINQKDNLVLNFDFSNIHLSKVNNEKVEGIKVFWSLKNHYNIDTTKPLPPNININDLANDSVDKDHLKENMKNLLTRNDSLEGMDPNILTSIKTILKKVVSNYENNVLEIIEYKDQPIFQIIRSNHNITKIKVFKKNNLNINDFFSVISSSSKQKELIKSYLNNNLEYFKSLMIDANFIDENNKLSSKQKTYLSYLKTLQEFILKTSIIGKLPLDLNFKLPDLENLIWINNDLETKKYWMTNQYKFNGSLRSTTGANILLSKELFDLNNFEEFNALKEKTIQTFIPFLVTKLYDINGKDVLNDPYGTYLHDTESVLMQNASFLATPQKIKGLVFYKGIEEPILNKVSNIYKLKFEDNIFHFKTFENACDYLLLKLEYLIKPLIFLEEEENV